MDGVVQIMPRVLGVWETEGAEYDEKIHKCTVDIVPTVDFRSVLYAISVRVFGAKDSTARIASITLRAVLLASPYLMVVTRSVQGI